MFIKKPISKRVSKGIILLSLSTTQSCHLGIVEHERIEMEKKYASPKDKSQFISVNNTRVHFRREGNPNGETLLLIHGICDSLHTWDKWTTNLKEEYQILRIDLPGFGLTHPVHIKKWDRFTYAHFIKAFLDKLEIKKVHIGGNSLGGYAAWTFAYHYPEQVEKIVLVDPAAYPMKKPPLPLRLANIPLVNTFSEWSTPKWFFEKISRQVYAKPANMPQESLERYYDLMLTQGNRQLYNFVFRKLMEFKDIYPKEISSIKNPTLLIWGAKDRWIDPKQAELWRQDHQNIKINILKNSGHVPQEEHPKETTKLVRDFLK